jgi:hypothetical protein
MMTVKQLIELLKKQEQHRVVMIQLPYYYTTVSKDLLCGNYNIDTDEISKEDNGLPVICLMPSAIDDLSMQIPNHD